MSKNLTLFCWLFFIITLIASIIFINTAPIGGSEKRKITAFIVNIIVISINFLITAIIWCV